MSYIVDRRLNGKNKSTVNRQRFLKRYKKHIKKAVSDAVTRRSITDLESGENVTIPKEDISEPVFHHGSGGKRTIIHPGNREFIKGDKVPRPPSGGGGAGEGQASDSGEGIDDFVFQITQDEFLEFLFEDLELPNLVKRKLAGIESFKFIRAGVVNEGTPNRINIVRSMRSATGRRIALSAASKRRMQGLEVERDDILALEVDLRDQERLKEINLEIDKILNRIKKIPFIDTYDLRYNNYVKFPQPTSQAVMFCLMDVSGSMNQVMKDMAKRFFILLYLFLKRNYKKIDVVFIRHHTSAKEVDEQEFFYSRETGGTIVSSALKLMKEVMNDRYPASEWNIYAAQASDGDNWNDDSPTCGKILEEDILPYTQYFSYIEINPRRHQALWKEYEAVLANYPETFAMQQISDAGEIYPVFRELFQRKQA